MRNNPSHIYLLTAYRHITAFNVNMRGIRYEFCLALT